MDESLFVFREKRLRVNFKSSAPWFINFGSRVPKTNSHVSLYAFTKHDADLIASSGSVKSWSPVHFSQELVVDCDTHCAAKNVESVLTHQQVSFDKYFSGNKGFHFHIPREARPTKDLCLRDKMLAEFLFPDAELDTGIYRPMHLIRGIGCYHEVGRKSKEQVRRFEGHNRLSVVDLQPTDKQISALRQQESADSRSEWARFQDRVLQHHPVGGKGNRNLALFCLAKDLSRSGLSDRCVEELCGYLNSAFEFPHDEVEVEKAIKSALKQVSKT
jgi:Primase C terminal 1 (PriCT-1)